MAPTAGRLSCNSIAVKIVVLNNKDAPTRQIRSTGGPDAHAQEFLSGIDVFAPKSPKSLTRALIRLIVYKCGKDRTGGRLHPQGACASPGGLDLQVLRRP